MKSPEKTQTVPSAIVVRLATVVFLLGNALMILGITVLRLFDSFSYKIEAPSIVGVYVGFFLASAIAPLLAACAALSVLKNWRGIVRADNISGEIVPAGTLARRFLLAASLFVVTASVVAVLAFVLERGVLLAMFADWMILWYTAIVLLAGVLGAISYKLFAHLHSRPLARLLAACTVLLALGLAGRSLLEVNLVSYLLQRAQYAGRRETFAGDSNALGSTAIIPTLDTPCPANKNVIWCSSFQLAWNQMKTDIFDGPVPVLGAEDLAGRLNGAGQSAADLEPQSYYAATGWSDQGIASQIEKDMAARFPNHALPELGDGEGIIMYSYVRANVPFEYPFLEADAGFHFTDSLGNRTTVRGFGMWEGDLPRNEDASRQVEVLYYHSSESDSDSETTEFAVDMCRFSSPYQVVIASVPFEGSLTGTCEYVRDRIDAYQASPSYDQNSGDLGGLDVLLVPEMFWKIEHHFPELIGKTVAYGGTAIPIMEAMQTVSFRLDRHGAMLESESAGFYGGLPRYLICDRPFLVYMQKRGAEHPFFVMWVDNAELLTRR